MAECGMKGGWVSSLSDAVEYPNPITNGFTADDIYLFERKSGGVSVLMLRGLQPGLLHTMETMPRNDSLGYRTIYRNLDDSGDNWMYFRGFNQRGFLVNLTAWEI